MFQREMSGMENAATALQLRFESAVLEQKKLHSLACKGIETTMLVLYYKTNVKIKNFNSLSFIINLKVTGGIVIGGLVTLLYNI